MRARTALAACALLSGCGTGPAVDADRVVVELVFGLSADDGSGVGEPQWQNYVEEILARAVPGFTIIPCEGGYRDDGRTVREACRHVIVLIDHQAEAALSQAVAEYKRRFRQQSVLWLERPCPPASCRLE